jgi:hypothetical protein
MQNNGKYFAETMVIAISNHTQQLCLRNISINILKEIFKENESLLREVLL